MRTFLVWVLPTEKGRELAWSGPHAPGVLVSYEISTSSGCARRQATGPQATVHWTAPRSKCCQRHFSIGCLGCTLLFRSAYSSSLSISLQRLFSRPARTSFRSEVSRAFALNGNGSLPFVCTLLGSGYEPVIPFPTRPVQVPRAFIGVCTLSRVTRAVYGL
jgi:hypothetical protein